MSLLQLAVFAAAGILIGAIKKPPPRIRLIVFFSALVIYWLQPASAIRYLEFWLPTLTIALVILVYAACFPDSIREHRNLADLGILAAVWLTVGLLRYLGVSLTSTTPPQFSIIALYSLGLLAAIAALTMLKAKRIPVLVLLVLILTIFLFLKNEHLAQLSSVWLRKLTGQDPALARSFELIWLGYSYTAFRLLHILFDKRKDRLPDMDLAEFASYVIFFPAFIAGPIDRVQNFTKQMRASPVIDAARFIAGMERLTLGIFKKFVLADSLALISLNAINAEQINNTLWGWIILYAYSFRILLDFSGYTDIAIGIGIFTGIQLPENFNRPYLKSNLTEFWNNWHMTLTQWFRAYFFNPLTRALRSAKVEIPLPLIIATGQVSTMVIIGLWHGISWSFVSWGAWHGIGLFIHNRWSTFLKNRQLNSNSAWLRAFGTIFTFQYVALGWVWFVLPSPELGWQFFQLLFGVV
jgi:alginate O-acetyltransferase complex protein AlgI